MEGPAKQEAKHPMSGTSNSRTLRLEVKNFGPITRAEIDLRPLTVFVGPSNTGKSYLAILIYALHLLFADRRDRDFGAPALGGPSFAGRVMQNFNFEEEMNDDLMLALQNWLADDGRGSTEDASGGDQRIPSSVGRFLKRQIESTDGIEDDLSWLLARCFGLPTEVRSFIRKGSSGGISIALRSMDTPSANEDTRFDFHAVMRARSSNVSVEIGQEAPHVLRDSDLTADTPFFPIGLLRMVGRVPKDDLQFIYRDITAQLIAETASHLLGPLSHDAYYLPAARTGIMQAHQIVVSSLIRQAPTAGLRRSPQLPTLSGVLSDFLNELIEAGSSRTRTDSTVPLLADMLENSVMEGRIESQIEESGYPSFFHVGKENDLRLPLMKSSSMVSELAPVVLYLKHHVDIGDTLIIEEPESHLHPVSQAELAIYLAKLVHAGIRVVVTTHSEWLVDQFTNLARLAEIDSSDRAKFPYGDMALSTSDLGVWRFKRTRRSSGSTVQEIKIDPEEGVLDPGFGAVASTLYDAWVNIDDTVRRGGS